MADAHKNFSYSTVLTAPSPATSGTSLVVASGQGALFPAVPFNATVWPSGTQPTAANAEIVRVTNISTDTFTITRAQEGSSARTVIVGDQIAATVTAKSFTDIENAIPTQVGGVVWTVIAKSIDESVSSNTVVQADDELLFTTVNSAVYEVEFFVIYGSPAGAGTPDIKITVFGEDATVRGALTLISGVGTGDAIATVAGIVLNNATATFGLGTAATNRVVMFKGWYVGAGGNVTLMWSQNVSGVNATIVRAGSILRYRRIV